MTRYIYHVSVHKQDALCPDVHAVTAFINDTMGCKFVTLDMVYNYFNRQRLSNKRIFGAQAGWEPNESLHRAPENLAQLSSAKSYESYWGKS